MIEQFTLFDAKPPIPAGTVTQAPAPDLADYHVIAVSDSGGKDSHASLAVTAEGATAAAVFDRLYIFHASLGPLEWPAVGFGGRRYASVGELASLHSAAYGIPPARHIEVQRTARDAAGELVPYSLLTFIAERGMFPARGRQFCTSDWKTRRIFAAWTPLVRQLRPIVGGPVRILNVLGLRRVTKCRRRHQHRSVIRPYAGVFCPTAFEPRTRMSGLAVRRPDHQSPGTGRRLQ